VVVDSFKFGKKKQLEIWNFKFNLNFRNLHLEVGTSRQEMRARSALLRGFTSSLRLAICDATVAAEAGRQRWRIEDPLAAALYAKALVSSVLLSAFLKGEERSILHIVCSAADAPVRELYAECLQLGEVRGYAAGVALGRGGAAPDWDGRLSAGSFNVTRVLYGAAAPVRSSVAITEGDVEAELRSFWVLSEQRGAQVALDARADGRTGALLFAGGVLVEALAAGGGRGAATSGPEEGGFPAGGASAPPPRLADLLAGGEPLAAAAAAYAPEFRDAPVLSGAGAEMRPGALQRVPLDFFCRCSAAGFLAKLLRAASAELLDKMAAEEEGGVAAKLECNFCNAVYAFSAAQLNDARKTAALSRK
jgi:redox-regulated HSP33 family molecular chaperone